MKKIIVAIALLLIATLALSVSAFSAEEPDCGQKTYDLGEFVKTAPVLDGDVKSGEYAVTYKLENGLYYVTETATGVTGSIEKGYLSAPANAAAATKSIEVSLAHDAANVYVAIKATLGEGVADANYKVTIDDAQVALVTVGGENEYKEELATDGEFSAIKDGVFVTEFAVSKDNDVVEGEFDLIIDEVTLDADNQIIQKALWNVVELTVAQKAEFAGVDFVCNKFSINAAVATGEEVVVTKAPVATLPALGGETPATTEPATTEPATTEPATTEPATTEPATTEPATTEPATTEPAATEPATTEPATTEPAPAKKGCKGSVGFAGIALVAALGTCATVLTKKED